ncbi:MAG: molybdopterin-dependent oxidoreductase [Cyclobacteriaceae bacterium]
MSQNKNNPKKENQHKSPNDRRSFLAKAGLGLSAFFATPNLLEGDEDLIAENLESGEIFEYTHNNTENFIYSVCLGCNTGCPTKVKVQNGAMVKIDGNPYTPWGRMPHLPFNTPLEEAAKVDGAICPKGQGAIMTVNDPFRIKKVLKRVGPRGSQKWETIEFDQAVEEIVNGGKLFSKVIGEENRLVEGLKEIMSLTDKKVASEMATAIDDIWDSKTEEEKTQKVTDFKIQFADHLHHLIDPNHPDLGPKNNQFLWMHGRLKAGRSEFFKRFMQDGLGTNNFHGHTTVCQGSLYFTGKAMSRQYIYDEKKKKTDWTAGDKFFWQADQHKAEFIIFVGSSPFEANYPLLRVPNIMNGLSSGRLKYAVVDPRYSKTCAHAWKWIPNKPGTEAALAYGMIRWIIENEKYDKKYLGGANKAAAKENGEPTMTNASWLIKITDGKPGKFLRGSDIGLSKINKTETENSQTRSYAMDPFIVIQDGNPVAFDNEDTNKAINGDLFVTITIKGVEVKTALQLVKEEAMSNSIEGWAEISGTTEKDIVELADEFTSHGKKAVFDMHRGVSQHTNGFYNCLAGNTLNLLIGNFDWKGGFVKYSTYDVTGGKAQGPFDFANSLNPGKKKTFGLNILRNQDYEKSTLFSGYPAKRPWFPHASDIYQEILPAISDGYPYNIKALLLYMGTPGYSLPAGQTQINVLANIEKLPLFIASDITIGESSMYADYIIPDLAFYERWEFHGSHPNNIWKVQTLRQPAMQPYTDIVMVNGEEMPISLESFMLAVAEKMELEAFGRNGFEEGMDFMKPEDLYLRMVANLAYGEKNDGSAAVPDASDEEIRIFKESRRHLTKSVFDYDRWKSVVGEEHWRKAVYIMNRGGRYQNYEEAYQDEQVTNKYGKMVSMYIEKVAGSKNALTGESFIGYPKYLPLADSIGNPLKRGDDTLHMITHKEIFHTKSRTPGNKLLKELYPINHVLINPIDAERLGLKNLDKVRITSDSNPEGIWELPNYGKKHMIGQIKFTEGMRPGVMGYSLGFGHWAYGSQDVEIDNEVLKGDPDRGVGFHANAAMMIDPHLKNVSLQDMVGGSVSFYDSPIRLEKVTSHSKSNMELS